MQIAGIETLVSSTLHTSPVRHKSYFDESSFPTKGGTMGRITESSIDCQCHSGSVNIKGEENWSVGEYFLSIS
jgi:hypothetical protein